MMDPDDYAEIHESREELRATLADSHPIITCPIGERENCKYFHMEGSFDDDGEYWCEHPSLGENSTDEYCPLEEEEDEDED